MSVALAIAEPCDPTHAQSHASPPIRLSPAERSLSCEEWASLRFYLERGWLTVQLPEETEDWFRRQRIELALAEAIAAKGPPTVVEALSRVMEDVQAVKKQDRNQQQNYSFRGVDAVVNAVGPILRKHGVVVVPCGVTYEAEQYQTRNGASMRNVTMLVKFRFYGPAGDHIEASALGEAADAGDKAVPKAHSVAFRTLLLQALCIPTDEPDPDSESHERPDYISRAQVQRFHTIRRKRLISPERAQEILLELTGQQSSTMIRADQYDAVIAALEAEPEPAVA